MTDIEKVLEAIDRIDKKLDAWIEKYEQADFIPGHDPHILPTMPTYDIDPNFGVSRCVKCSMEFRGSTGYVCSRSECPMGLNWIAQVLDKGEN